MSSSLDELQPNDYLQQELEELLREFMNKKGADYPFEKIVLFNHFIEYVCFHLNLGEIKMVFLVNVIDEFCLHFTTVFPLTKEQDLKNTLSEFQSFVESTF